MNMFGVWIFSFSVAIFLFDSGVGVKPLTDIRESNLIYTEWVIRSTINAIFSILKLRNIQNNPRIQEYTNLHNKLISRTLEEYYSLTEITKLTRVDKGNKIEIEFIALINEILDEENDESVLDHQPHLTNTRRIFKGKRVKIKKFPFMASVEIFGKFQCGGSIVKSDLVITAASCLQLAWNNRFFRENPPFLSVRVGSSFYQVGGEVIRVQEIYFYPGYVPQTLRDNLALMRLERHINFKKKGRAKIKIRKIHIDYDVMLPEKVGKITIVGWGASTASNKLKGPYEDKLKYATLEIYIHRECQKIYSSKLVTGRNFCAGFMTKGIGACHRDVGGPGIIDGQLTGVISYGPPNCGSREKPVVLVKLGFYSDWIESIMKMDVPKKRLHPTKQMQGIMEVPLTTTPISVLPFTNKAISISRIDNESSKLGSKDSLAILIEVPLTNTPISIIPFTNKAVSISRIDNKSSKLGSKDSLRIFNSQKNEESNILEDFNSYVAPRTRKPDTQKHQTKKQNNSEKDNQKKNHKQSNLSIDDKSSKLGSKDSLAILNSQKTEENKILEDFNSYVAPVTRKPDTQKHQTKKQNHFEKPNHKKNHKQSHLSTDDKSSKLGSKDSLAILNSQKNEENKILEDFNSYVAPRTRKPDTQKNQTKKQNHSEKNKQKKNHKQSNLSIDDKSSKLGSKNSLAILNSQKNEENKILEDFNSYVAPRTRKPDTQKNQTKKQNHSEKNKQKKNHKQSNISIDDKSSKLGSKDLLTILNSQKNEEYNILEDFNSYVAPVTRKPDTPKQQTKKQNHSEKNKQKKNHKQSNLSIDDKSSKLGSKDLLAILNSQKNEENKILEDFNSYVAPRTRKPDTQKNQTKKQNHSEKNKQKKNQKQSNISFDDMSSKLGSKNSLAILNSQKNEENKILEDFNRYVAPRTRKPDTQKNQTKKQNHSEKNKQKKNHKQSNISIDDKSSKLGSKDLLTILNSQKNEEYNILEDFNSYVAPVTRKPDTPKQQTKKQNHSEKNKQKKNHKQSNLSIDDKSSELGSQDYYSLAILNSQEDEENNILEDFNSYVAPVTRKPDTPKHQTKKQNHSEKNNLKKNYKQSKIKKETKTEKQIKIHKELETEKSKKETREYSDTEIQSKEKTKKQKEKSNEDKQAKVNLQPGNSSKSKSKKNENSIELEIWPDDNYKEYFSSESDTNVIKEN